MQLKEQLRSIWQNRGIEGIHHLINLDKSDPELAKRTRVAYGNLNTALKDVLGFGIPLKRDQLEKWGVLDHLLLLMVDDYELALEESRSWHLDKREFDRLARQYEKRKAELISEWRKLSPDESFEFDALELKILENEGLHDLQDARSQVLDEYRTLWEEEGLPFILNVPTTNRELNSRARAAKLHHLDILKMIGVTESTIESYIEENQVVEEAFRLFMYDKIDDFHSLCKSLRLPMFRRKFWLSTFQEQKDHFLREDSGITESDRERQVNKYFHEQQIDGWYWLHRHHVPYDEIMEGCARNYLADFTIGPFLIEVADVNLPWETPGGFYEQNIQNKIRLAKKHKVPMIVLRPVDFDNDAWLRKLEPVREHIDKGGLEGIMPKGMFTFRDDMVVKMYNPDAQQYYKRQHAWWRPSTRI